MFSIQTPSLCSIRIWRSRYISIIIIIIIYKYRTRERMFSRNATGAPTADGLRGSSSTRFYPPRRDLWCCDTAKTSRDRGLGTKRSMLIEHYFSIPFRPPPPSLNRRFALEYRFLFVLGWSHYRYVFDSHAQYFTVKRTRDGSRSRSVQLL